MKTRNDARKFIACVVALLCTLSVAAHAQAPRGDVARGARRSEAMQSLGYQPGQSMLNRVPRYPKVDKRTVTFKTQSQLVLVPVVVRDNKGVHVSGLTSEKFTVLEDGKPQRITVFEEIRKASGPITRPEAPPGIYTNAVDKETSPKQLTILLLDLLNTPFTDQARARDHLLKYLAETVNENTPTSLLILSRRGVRVVHDFTADPRMLANALRKAQPEHPDSHEPPPQSNLTINQAATALLNNDPSVDINTIIAAIDAEAAGPSTEYVQASAIAGTMEAFQHIAQSFAGVPGRKALVWATASFPFAITESSGIVGSGQPSSLYERTMQMLNTANIAVYPVDVRGLVYFGPNESGVQHAASIGTMEMVAQMTGGRAFYNRNELHRSFQEATDDSAAYYMLGYQLDTSNKVSGWRKLKVEVADDRGKVRARSGFFVTPVTEDPEYSRQVDIYNALQSPLDYTSLPVVVRWLEVKQDRKETKATFEVILSPGTVEIDAGSGNRVELEFVAVARDEKGKPAGEFAKTVESKLQDDGVRQVQTSGITYKDVITVPRGTYKVRFVVRDNNSGRTGSVQAQLTDDMAAAK